jgi:hypothetical protein
MYVCDPISPTLWYPTPACHTNINFTVLEPLLQVIIDSFIANLANQREIAHANLLLLRALKHRLLCELRLLLPGFRAGGGGVFFAARALGNRLYRS